jgi:hypothetical protein
MSSLDFDLDTQMSDLEIEWRRVCESSILARADYRILTASAKANASLIDMARERVVRAEALKARIMAKMERLENNMLGQE